MILLDDNGLNKGTDSGMQEMLHIGVSLQTDTSGEVRKRSGEDQQHPTSCGK